MKLPVSEGADDKKKSACLISASVIGILHFAHSEAVVCVPQPVPQRVNFVFLNLLVFFSASSVKA